jgi:hypothetical protein
LSRMAGRVFVTVVLTVLVAGWVDGIANAMGR